MRRLPSLAVLAASVLAMSAALPVATSAGAQVSRVVFAGEVAVGEWSTCPTWHVGDRCLFTRVIAANSVTRELWPDARGRYLTMTGPSVVLQHTWFQVVEADGELAGVPWRESAGGVGVPGFPGSGANPTVRLDTRLRSGTASATDLRIAVSEEASDWETVWRSVSVRTSWRGLGALERVREGAIFHSTDRRTTHASTTGWQRQATASGSDSFAGSWGTFLGGTLFHVRQVEAVAYRGHPTSGLTSLLDQLRGVTPAAATLVQRTRLTSVYGEAGWTTCSTPRAGDRCRDAFLGYGAVTPSEGAPEQFALLQLVDYEVVAVEDGWLDVRELASVTAKVPVSSLVAPTDLSTAQVVVRDTEASVCDAGQSCRTIPVSFTGSWTGTGTPTRFAQHGVLWGDWGREWVHLRGSLRQATATAAVSGLPAELGMNGPVQGRLLTASMSTSRERHQTR